MNECGKSDGPIVPQTPANNVGDGRLACSHPASSSAEQVEGRGPAKGNSLRGPEDRTQGRDPLHVALERIRQAARRDKTLRLTALWHHVYNVARLRREYYALKPHAAPGVDGQTWYGYGSALESNLRDLSGRLKRGAHDALDALSVGITWHKISWVLDADIRGFFDAIDHEWLVKFVAHRITYRRVVRHIKKWLRAGVLEDGKRMLPDRGTPQGGSHTPQTML